MTRTPWPLAVLLASVLAACGGGGSSGGSSPTDDGGAAPGGGGSPIGTDTPPSGATISVAPVRLAAGTGYSLAVRSDGSVIAWGTGMAGGAGAALPGTAGAHVVDGVSGAAAVAAMRVAPPFNSALVLQRDGTVLRWGRGSGDAPAVVAAAGKLEQVVACFDGADYGLRADGTVWRFTPSSAVQVAGLQGIRQIGEAHTSNQCAITAIDAAGALSVVDGEARVQAVAGLPAVQQAVCNFSAAALTRYCLAVSTTGRLWAWGANDAGQLGDGTQLDRPTPVELPAPVQVASVAASVGTSFARTSDGAVYSWGGGIGNLDRLGREAGLDALRVPGRVQGLPAIAELAAGPHMLARASDGTVWSWGSNTWGEGGTGTAGDNAFLPHPVDGVRLD